MNAIALELWAFCAGVGYLIKDGRGAIAGLVLGLGLSLFSDLRRVWMGNA